MTRSPSFVAILVAVQVTTPVMGAISAHVSGRIGIVHATALRESDDRFSRLERRIQRWLERETDLEVSVISTGALAREVFEVQARRAKLSDLIEAVAGQPLSSPIWEELRMERESLRNLAPSGPVVQLSLAREAKETWQAGERGRARELLEEAMRLHPDAVLDGESESEEEDVFTDWDRLRLSVSSSLKGICELQLDSSPVEAKLSVNGFPLGQRRAFHLSAGASYHFELTAPGRAPWKTDYRCTRQSSRRFVAHLNTGTPAAGADLASLTRAQEVESLLLVGEEAGRVKLFLYSPSGRLDEVPVTEPIRVADLADSSASSSLPIVTDAFLNLVESHRLAMLGIGSSLTDVVGSSRLEEVRGPASRWYNNWKFWAATGGVLLGVLATILVTRGNDVKHQVGMAVRLE